MPKSKLRKNHKKKVTHQRMLDKHKDVKIQKENEKKLQEFQQMLSQLKSNKDKGKEEYIKALAENTEPTNSEVLTKSLTEAVFVEQTEE